MVTLDVDEWSVANWQVYVLVCERCYGAKDVELRPSMTAYADPDENRPQLLCPVCADEYSEYWKNQWAEYNAGRY